MSAHRRPFVVEVRPTRAADGDFIAACAWVALDSRGYRFAADSEHDARELADQYHAPRHTTRERGRVSHPARELAPVMGWQDSDLPP